eukprot:7243803-Pyramimonas_sp.AAC.1
MVRPDQKNNKNKTNNCYDNSRKVRTCQTAWGNPRHGGREPQGSFVGARGGRPGGERFARESFVPEGVKRKIWSCAARSVSDWGSVHPL